MVSIHGQMAVSTKVSGSKESSTAWACLQLPKARKGTGSGEMANFTKNQKKKKKNKHKKKYEPVKIKSAINTKYLTEK